MAEKLERLHEKHPDMGYRRLNDKLRHDEDIQVNDKRILRICRKKQIRSNLKSRYNGCTRASNNPAFIAENILNREFKAEHLNEKWVTDVTEFKYGNTLDSVHKVYLSAILDLCDRRPVAYVIGDSNNNALVFETFDKAVKANPGAHPIFHSDRGYQYTSRRFHQKLEEAGMVQSMSRVAHCTDNGVMEGFWGILKREMYYGKKFESREELEKAITEYIDKTISFYDAGTEGFYHGLLLGLVSLTDTQYKIKSNRESGDGRYDISLIPRNKKYSGIIIELKSKGGLNEAELEKLSETALEQINSNRYSTEMEKDGITNILKMGIAFSGKKMEIKTQTF